MVCTRNLSLHLTGRRGSTCTPNSLTVDGELECQMKEEVMVRLDVLRMLTLSPGLIKPLRGFVL